MTSKLIYRLIAAAVAVLAATATGTAQEPRAFFQRLPVERLDLAPPSSRVRGEPGRFTLESRACRAEPVADVRRRIVDIVVQEWAFFGFSVVDETDPANWVRRRGRQRELDALIADPQALRDVLLRRAQEAARVAPSIAGFWAVTADGAWIVDRHNGEWRASGGTAARWRDPWSAAFISWVMCEAGFSSPEQFQRAVAHHVYIDQAIRARDGEAPNAVFVAHEVGEEPIVPGDLLCLARRPAYRTLADRRSQMGAGARTHCDVVVKVDEERALLLAIGGNVRGTVGLKLLPAERKPGGPLQPLDRSAVPGARSMFAHLKLRAEPIEASAFDTSPTIAAALACANPAEAPPQLVAVTLLETARTEDC